MKTKYLLMFLIIMCLGITGCSSFIEFSGVTAENVSIPFDNYYQGVTYLEENDSSFWMESYRYIADDTQWEEFKKTYLADVDEFPSIDFETESLYVLTNSSTKGLVRSFDVKELTYNEETFTVIISQEDSTVISDAQGKTAYWFNIVKVNKTDFPSEERDWLLIPDK